MNLEDFLPNYPDVSDIDLQQKILNKKEFFDLKLAKELEVIEKNESLSHQKIIQRFMNNYTLYDELLLVHETGTGKTGVAFGVTEKLFGSKSFRKVYVLARGGSLLISLMKQLVFVHSKRYVLPKDIEPGNQLRHIRKITSDFYQFQTYETFCKSLGSFSDEIVKNNYENSIFILDEVHNIKSDETASIYSQFHRLFHLLENRKILLMSATPMRDNVNELAYIMNLILPLDVQLPVDIDFDAKFIENESIIRGDELKEYLRGRISFLSNSSVNVVKTKYLGNFITNLNIEQFKVYGTRMESKQLKGYSAAYLKDIGDERSIYANSRQAALFVFPNETYGQEGLQIYTNTKSGALKPDLTLEVSSIDRLRKLSSKYAFVIQNILDNPDKLVYIYCSVVNGSGINLLSKILERYGFSRAKGTEKTKGRRYISLTSQMNNIDLPLSFFNSKRNMFGDYCQVIIGSKKISEGFTFKNIQIIHVLTFHWNYTEIQQAIARGIRYRSHDQLISAGYEPIVQIYQHASIVPTDKIKSIDLLMMETSQSKDILVRKMLRVIKEISFDCPLTYERNYKDGIDNSRECDYQECEYKCDSSLEPTKIDLSTYNLYYQNVDDTINKIQKLFSERFSMSFQSIQELLEIDTFPLLQALSDLIRYNTPIINKYGLICYLRESFDEYYLVDNVALPNNRSELCQYAKTPFVTKNQSLKNTIRDKSVAYDIGIIRQLKSLNTSKDLKIYLENLSLEVQEMILEQAVLNEETTLGSMIINIYKPFLKSTDKYKYISILLSPRTRCYDKSWRDCIYEKILPENKNIESDNPYGVYGIQQDEQFCIKEIVPLKPGEKIDKRKQKSGSNCLEVGWNKPKLAELCIRLNIEIPPKELNIDSKKVLDDISKTKVGKKTILDWQGKGWTTDEILRGLYWYKQTKEQICNKIKDWLNRNNLLITGECGKSGKKK